MPQTWFYVQWPDNSESRCYSPSTTVYDYFEPGDEYSVDEFLRRCREALNNATERVRAKYGYACSSAADQLTLIEEQATPFRDDPEARVRIERFET